MAHGLRAGLTDDAGALGAAALHPGRVDRDRVNQPVERWRLAEDQRRRTGGEPFLELLAGVVVTRTGVIETIVGSTPGITTGDAANHPTRPMNRRHR